jgi:transposase
VRMPGAPSKAGVPGRRGWPLGCGNRSEAAARTKGTFLSARYKRIMTRRGHRRALVAVARTILQTC